ncbi:XkdX family protein [Loigolactobacillus backii]|uniref:XkdX family protein n=1 Tax=Loigolactobacillus backii TaxID=375175 RepID=UPI000AD0FE96|nr:XkdX family protein [Loigolactobacillus backii]
MTKEDVAAQVAKSAITADQYKTIVGEEYQVPAASTTPVGTSTVASDSTAATSSAAE